MFTKTDRMLVLVMLLFAVMVFMTGCGASEATTESTSEDSTVEAAATTGDETEDVASDVDEAAAAANKTGKRIYFAGPLFNQAEKDYNLMMAEMLESHGYEVFLPQRDGIEAALLEGKTEEELTEMIFEKDYGEIMKSDILFMNMDGRVPDEGACVELGIAYAQGLRCYGFKTDTRSVEINMDVNPMLTGCFVEVFKDYDGDKLIEQIEEYLSQNEL